MTCDLCNTDGGEILWRDAALRIVRIKDDDYPTFCRVIWQTHLKEMTDLNVQEQTHLMQSVFAVEAALRETINPDKVNLASLGNMTPHLHWHVIPRFSNDRHFPQPVWATATRTNARASIDLVDFDFKMKQALQKALS
jgi:diadenosine tetraphosphate (Ap4A) HIT family hydrolase